MSATRLLVLILLELRNLVAGHGTGAILVELRKQTDLLTEIRDNTAPSELATEIQIPEGPITEQP